MIMRENRRPEIAGVTVVFAVGGIDLQIFLENRYRIVENVHWILSLLGILVFSYVPAEI